VEEVIERARAGDRDALAQLWRTYNHVVLRYFRGRNMAEPDDLASAVWIDVARGLARFQGDEGDFRRWLFTIAARRRVDAIRYDQRRAVETWQRPHESTRNNCSVAPDTADVADRAAALERAIALVQKLPDDQAEAVLLRVVADLSVSDVAHIMGRTEGHIRVLVHRGLEKLAEIPVTNPPDETMYQR
jgi:RNA polymerase sigma-70 factor (ECF subfamily)